MDYKFEQTKSGRMKVKEEFTPARRWSFLVGENEKSHTAQSRLVNILANDEKAPTLEEIEKAFDIETVTKEFFLKYRELFLRTKEELDRVIKKDPKIKADFEAKGVDTVNFAKKLLGQIIFLYFLQKKGWFGVGRDEDWGTGSKRFLRELFEKKHADYNNFFNDILEPLFYEALRTGEDRKHEDYYYSRFNCKIPFLNGGLFDPIGNYDWVHTDIIIPDRLFSNNIKTKEGDAGTGILDVFDRYNFTVKEDEPLEKEVAIDPELLGKAYEKFNAIRPDNYDEFRKALKSGKTGEENKFNKKFGVYYTPREIVHYMCQQSLINYLAIELSSVIPNEARNLKEDIETLIHTGEQVSEIEARVISEARETKTYSHKLPEIIRNNAALIDEKLADITVCDPAVGSGAFPVGMMNEIVRTRNVLSTFIHRQDACAIYEFKRQCIEHSLYGVDIDPGAVEIAKLRLWLSLVVDEDDIKNIKPLPNLDYRIMQGNSLISEFMGINFDSDKDKSGKNLMFKDETDELIEQFQQKKDEFLNESHVTRKSKLKEEVEDLLVKIFETKLITQKADYFNRLKKIENKYSVLHNEKQRDKLIKQDKEKLYKESGFDLESAEKQLKEFTSGKKIKPFFLWDIYFSEVFYNKGGFDVVIANPPYITVTLGKKQDFFRKGEISILKKRYSDVFEYKGNTYALFLKRSFSILGSEKLCTFIIPNTLLLNSTFEKMRKFLLANTSICNLVNITDKVFQDAEIGGNLILIYKTGKSPDGHNVKSVEINELGLFDSNLGYNRIPQESYLLVDGCRFYLDITSLEIMNKIRYESIMLDKLACFYNGIKTGNNKKFIADSKMDKRYRKILRGRDIERYRISFNNKFVLFDKRLLWSNTNEEKLTKHPKIVMRQTGDRLVGALDTKGYLTMDTTHLIFDTKVDILFLLAILNSNLMNWFHRAMTAERGRAFAEVKIINLKKLPVKTSGDYQTTFVKMVDEILNIIKGIDFNANPQKQAEVKSLEAEIDQLVYKLYDLTQEEIKIVEGENENAD